MLRDVLGVALIGVGILTVYARLMARTSELRRPARDPERSSRRKAAPCRERRRKR